MPRSIDPLHDRMRKLANGTKAKELDVENYNVEVLFTLSDFMGDPEKVRDNLLARGFELTEEQVVVLKEVFAEGVVLDPIGPIAGVYETCGPKSRTKVCF